MPDAKAWEAVEAARKQLGLGKSATLAEIQAAYHARALEVHPDRWPADRQEWCHEQMAALNRAYDLLREYCAGYRFSFDPDDVRRELARRDPYLHWLSQFGPDEGERKA